MGRSDHLAVGDYVVAGYGDDADFGRVVSVGSKGGPYVARAGGVHGSNPLEFAGIDWVFGGIETEEDGISDTTLRRYKTRRAAETEVKVRAMLPKDTKEEYTNPVRWIGYGDPTTTATADTVRCLRKGDYVVSGWAEEADFGEVQHVRLASTLRVVESGEVVPSPNENGVIGEARVWWASGIRQWEDGRDIPGGLYAFPNKKQAAAEVERRRGQTDPTEIPPAPPEPAPAKTVTYTVPSNPLVCTPGMFRNILDRKAMQLAPKESWRGAAMYFLAGLLPTIPAGVLLDLVEGTRTWSVEGDTVVISGG